MSAGKRKRSNEFRKDTDRCKADGQRCKQMSVD